MINVIVCAATNLFRVYLVYRFIRVLVGGKLTKIGEVIAYSTFFLINTGLYLTFYMAWINLASSLIGVGLLVALYTKSLRTILFTTCSINILTVACDAFSVLLFVEYEDGKIFNQVYYVVTVFLIFVCELLVEKIVNCKRKVDAVQSLPLIIIPSCSIFIIVFVTYSKNISQNEIIVISIILLLMNFATFYLYNLLLKFFLEKYENDMLKQRIQSYSNQMEIIHLGEEKVKTLRHDLRHHINELRALSMKGDVNAIQQYINEMGAFLQNSGEIVSSGNIEIDSILNYMLQKAEQDNLCMNVKVQLPDKFIHTFDLVVVLGNLLENAIEASKQTDEKLLNVMILFKQDVLKISIENSYSGKLILNEKTTGEAKLKTTKSEKDLHGIGLNSVRQIVKKYNGMMKIEPRNSIFSVKLVLYMNDCF